MSMPSVEIISRRIDADVDAMRLFQACESISDKDYRLLLESSEQGSNGKQQSILFLESALVIKATGQDVSFNARNENGQQALAIMQNYMQEMHGFEVIAASDRAMTLSYPDTRSIISEDERIKRLTSLDAVRQCLASLSAGQTHDAHKLMVAGVVGYDYVNVLETLPEIEGSDNDFPDVLMLLADSQIVLDKQARRLEIRQLIFAGERADKIKAQARGRISAIEQIVASDLATETRDVSRQHEVDFDSINIHPDRETFKEQIQVLKNGIDEGRIFQCVIGRQFQVPCDDPEVAYQILAQQNPSPYQFYLRMGQYTLFGASPESSLRYDSKARTISIMPIAGTRGRGRNPDGSINLEIDARLEADLKLDEKELAEHLMLVDLARNDLARIATTGSRHVSELMAIYRYASVMHMVSRVDAELKNELDIFHACQACFHMGTLSGAPKTEAMSLISEVEQRPRGVYGGAVGYFTAAGDMDSAIIIRSALVENDIATVSAGAGIVYDSIPDMEVRETELKASSVLRAIQTANEEGAEHD
ncbi:MAG: anthranilate synthase component 1 [Gammaproteobacteria bacterium]|nr:anthranilate synthase component 1 [Gammaproteobacteria bacterium]